MGIVSMDKSDGTYEEGKKATLKASANEGYEFVNWTDADGNTLDPDMTITQNTDCYAKWN